MYTTENAHRKPPPRERAAKPPGVGDLFVYAKFATTTFVVYAGTGGQSFIDEIIVHNITGAGVVKDPNITRLLVREYRRIA